MSVRLVLTAQAEDLVGAFTAELTEAGASTWPSTIGGARASRARYPVPAAFSALPVDEQLRLPAHQRRFACWLMVTARTASRPSTWHGPTFGWAPSPPAITPPARPARRHRANARLRRGLGARPVVRVDSWPRCTASFPSR